MDTSTVLFASVAGVIILTVLTFTLTGSFIATLVVMAIMGMIIFVLYQMGYITIGFDKSGGLDIGYHETPPAPSSSKKSEPKSLEVPEVFLRWWNRLHLR